MKRLILLGALVVLVSCGADGPPVAENPAPRGLSVSGEVTIGVVKEL